MIIKITGSLRRTSSRLGLILLLAILITPSLLVHKASALGGAAPTNRCGSPTYTWLNKSTISGNFCHEKPGNTSTYQSYESFVDSDPSDTNHTYTSSGDCSTDTLVVSNGNKTAKATIHTSTTTGGNPRTGAGAKTTCSASTSTVTLKNVQNAGKGGTVNTPNNPAEGAFGGDTYAWTDSTHIQANGPIKLAFSGSADSSTQIGTYKSGTYTVKGQNFAQCPATITVNLADPGGDNTKGTLHAPAREGKSGCDGTGSTFSITIGGGSNAPKLIAADGSTSSDQKPTCESSGFSLSWIMCPIINGLADSVDSMYSSFIKPLLVTAPIDFSASDPTHMFQVWSQFRILGDIFLVIALLVIVFGQSIGDGLVDAYSAKKILPRLLIAAIAINLSIYLVAIAVDVTNVIGNGVAGLIQAPFHIAGAYKLHLNGAAAGASGLGLGALVLGLGWSAFAGGAFLQFVLLFVLLPAFLTFIAIVATVVIRRGLILFLVLISPIAFALYCLPNTEQYFKKWWDLLLKTLMVYPIIATIFAVSNVLSITIGIAGNTSATAATVSDLISIIALLIPLFLIPFSFKLAGGALGAIHDTISNNRKRMQEGIKGSANDPNSLRNRVRRNFATKNAENNLSARGIGAMVNPRNNIGRGANLKRRTGMASARDQYSAFYGKQGMGTATYEAFAQDSNVTGDLAKYGSRKASQDAIESSIAAYDRGEVDDDGKGVGFARGSAQHQRQLYASSAADRIGRNTANRRRALMNPVTIGYEFGDGQVGFNQASQVMNELAGGDVTRKAAMMDEFQAVAKGAAGRGDLAAAVGKDITSANGFEGYDGNKAYAQHSVYELANMSKPTEIKGHGRHFRQQFAEGGEDGKKAAATFVKDMQAVVASGGKKANVDEAQNQLNLMNAGGQMDRYLNEDTGAQNRDGSPKQTRYLVDDAVNPSGKREIIRNEKRDDTIKGRGYHQPSPEHMGEGEH